MSLLDDVKNKAADIAKNPDIQQKAKDFAEKHNISLEEAKKRLTNKDDEK